MAGTEKLLNNRIVLFITVAVWVTTFIIFYSLDWTLILHLLTAFLIGPLILKEVSDATNPFIRRAKKN